MLQDGQILEGRYRILSDGTPQDLGKQFKAYDTHSEQLVEVLVLGHRFAGGSDTLERLTRSQQRVNDLAQPGLLPYEYVGQVDRQYYLVRTHVEGQTLAEMLRRAGPMGSSKTLDVALPLCEALAAAHRAGLVHGSLAPHSVLVAADGQVTVMDTGLLPALRPSSPPTNQPWGRFPYISPEQAGGEFVHPASDVYVLGLLIYEMLTGAPPFYHGDEASQAMQHLRQDPAPLQTLAPDVPFPLVRIVHKALAKEPAVRYRNAGQLVHILNSQLGGPLAAGQPELTTPQLVPAREQLVVPPPPVRVPAAPQPGDVYGAIWEEEPAGVDWITVGLIVAALIAVLGLIPLWRTVYRRYAVPSPSTSQSHHWLEPAHRPDLLLAGVERREQSDMQRKRHLGFSVTQPGYVQLTDNRFLVWESRLRSCT